MAKFKWHTETRKLVELIPADYNPRQMSDKQAEKLKKSLDEFGYVETVDINLDNTVIGGHQRLKALADLGYEEIEVRVPDRKLTKKEEQTLNVTLNEVTGAFDNEKLMMLDSDVLEDAGFEPEELIEIEGETKQKLTEKEENVRFYKKIHVLISVPVDLMSDDLQKILTDLKKIKGVEFEQSAN